MKKISLEDFQNITGMPDSSLLYLLKKNKLKLEHNRENGILIDATDVRNDEIIRAVIKENVSTLKQHKDIIKERLSIIIGDQIELLLDEALGNLLE